MSRSRPEVFHNDEPIPFTSLPARIRGRLPRIFAPLTPLLGREADVAHINGLIRDRAIRLITLTGPGGVGKTRVALQIAADAASEFADGVALIELASINDPSLVVPTIAQTLGVRPHAQVAAIDALTSALCEQELLLLLDNFEQVVEAGPQVADILKACPRMTVLVTSRALLHIAGERRVVLPPLGLPDPANKASTAQIARSAAVRLFIERARAVNPDFAMTDTNAPAVAAIVQKLDGLPLAIELAASRSTLLTPTELAERLDNGHHILRGGARDAPARQQTMRNTIAWSHDLLDSDEQLLFRRLAVFSGSFTLEAAEWIMGDESWEIGAHVIPPPIIRHPIPDVFDLVSSLVAKSLIQRVENGHETTRFAMLTTIRDYAADILATSGEARTLRQRHAAYFLKLAERYTHADLLPESERIIARLEDEHPNLRAAMMWSAEAGEMTWLLRLTAALGRFWSTRGYYREGRDRLEFALAATGDGLEQVRGKALILCGMIALFQGAEPDAAERLTTGLALCREHGDAFHVTQALIGLGALATNQDDHTRATTLLEEAITAAGDITDQRLATIMAARAFDNLGVTARMQGDLALAAARHEAALRRERAVDYVAGIIIDLGDLADVARDQGDYRRAMAYYQEALGLIDESTGTRTITEQLEGMAAVAAAIGQPTRAARLFGAVDALRRRAGLGLRFPADHTAHERGVAAARTALGPDAFAVAWATGRALSHDQAVTEALEPFDLVVDAPPVALSKRELDVLSLLVAGHTDRQIAETLFIGRRTAEGHVRRIFEKLGVRTRTAAASRALAEGLIDQPSPSSPASHDEQ